MTDDTHAVDPASLPLEELRRRRRELQSEDDAVSYVRRVVHARLDLVTREIDRRDPNRSMAAGDDDLETVLARRLTDGPTSRPPRPTDDRSDAPLAMELDQLCTDHGFGRLTELDDGALAQLRSVLVDFEAEVSANRRVRFVLLDELSAELVTRYRSGTADVDGLLAD